MEQHRCRPDNIVVRTFRRTKRAFPLLTEALPPRRHWPREVRGRFPGDGPASLDAPVLRFTSHGVAGIFGEPDWSDEVDCRNITKEQTDRGLAEKRSVMSQLAALRVFEVFGRVGGIRRTAAALGLDPSVVSRHLHGLEIWLGTELIDREQRPAVLTKLGQRYHEKVRSGFEIINGATRNISNADYQNHLVIYSTHGLAHYIIFKHIDGFRKENPEIDIEIRPKSLNRGNALEDINYNSVDFISMGIDFVMGGQELPAHKQLHVLSLVRANVFPVVSPGWSNKSTFLYSVDSLMEQPILHADDDYLWRRWFECQGISVPEYIPGIRGWHSDYVFAATRRGEGIAMATDLVPAEDLARGELTPLRLCGGNRFEPAYGEYRLVGRQDQWSLRPVQIFRRWLQDIVRKEVDRSLAVIENGCLETR